MTKEVLERIRIHAELVNAGGIEAHNFWNEFYNDDLIYLLAYDYESEEIGFMTTNLDDGEVSCYAIGFRHPADLFKAVGKIGEERIRTYLFGANDEHA